MYTTYATTLFQCLASISDPIHHSVKDSRDRRCECGISLNIYARSPKLVLRSAGSSPLYFLLQNGGLVRFEVLGMRQSQVILVLLHLRPQTLLRQPTLALDTMSIAALSWMRFISVAAMFWSIAALSSMRLISVAALSWSR